jgi:hypothetical protein
MDLALSLLIQDCKYLWLQARNLTNKKSRLKTLEFEILSLTTSPFSWKSLASICCKLTKPTLAFSYLA